MVNSIEYGFMRLFFKFALTEKQYKNLVKTYNAVGWTCLTEFNDSIKMYEFRKGIDSTGIELLDK